MSALLAEEEKAQFQQQQMMMQQQQAQAEQAQFSNYKTRKMNQREAGAIREVADQMTKRTEQKQGK